MSNDRHDDKHVSAAYRELASERTPPHLDQKILAMASRAAKKPAYSRWMRWSRPAAWAATIMLCLAISLELAQDPTLDMPVESTRDMALESNSPATDPVPEQRKRDDDRQLSKEEMSLAIKPADLERQQETAESLAESAANERTSLARSAAKQSFDAPAPAAAKPEPVPTRAEEAGAMSGALMSEAFEADSFKDEDGVCAATQRATATDWLACIRELEANGLHDAAAVERELLIDTFPDFKLP